MTSSHQEIKQQERHITVMTLKLFLSCLPPLVPCMTLQAKGPYEVMGGCIHDFVEQ